MRRLIKILLGLVAGLAILVIAAVVLVPKLIDAEKYKAILVRKVTEATGRKVSLAGDLHVSVFPWVGVSMSDFRLGNPEGFGEEDFVVVRSFEAHVKLMPLLSQQVEVDTFVLDGAQIYLEKRKNGTANWQGLGRSDASAGGQQPPPSVEENGRSGFGIKSVEVGSFTISDARLTFIDHQQGVTKEISDLTLQLTDVNLTRPVAFTFSAMVDGKKIGLDGTVGPLAALMGQGALDIDLEVSALDRLTATVKGQVEDPTGAASYRLGVDVARFSPRDVLSGLGMGKVLKTADPKALGTMAMTMQLAGTGKNVSVTNGTLLLDDSKLTFDLDAKRFAPLDLRFAGKLDTIDLDRYLPPAAPAGTGQQSGKGVAEQSAVDYGPLRKLTLDTRLDVGRLKVRGGRVEKIQLRMVGDRGIFKLNPCAMELYGGKVTSTATVNVRGKSPATILELRTTNVQVGPLLKDFADKEVLEGNLVSGMNLSMHGDTPKTIKRTLNGKGELLFTDGAIVGVDLAGMVRNIQASFGLADKPTEKPRTDFAELRAPFTLKNGLFHTPRTSMQSPLLRVTAAGDADLVSEKLDMRVEPKFVATLKGQGDAEERKGLMVPVLVGGTFEKPKFTPDLTAILQGQLPDGDTLKRTMEELKPDKILPKDKDLKEGIKGLIPGLKMP